MLPQSFGEVRARDGNARPRFQPVLMRKIEKPFRRPGLIGMDEIKSALGRIAHGIFQAFAILRHGAQSVKPYGEELFATQQRNAVIPQSHRVRSRIHRTAEKHLVGDNRRTVIRIGERTFAL